MADEAKPVRLTRKQQVFIDEYLRCFNASEAARRAGYSIKTAYSLGWETLRKPEVSAEIERRLDEVRLGKGDVLKRLSDMATSDIGVFMDVSTVGWNLDLLQRNEKGELLLDANGNVIRKPETKLIKKIKQKVTTIQARNSQGDDKEIIETEIELYDAQAALEKLGRHHKLFTDALDITSGGEKLEIVIKYADSDVDPT